MGTARWILVAGLVAGVSSACSTETNLTVTARGESAEGETVPLSNVVLDVLPYDIDELYGELEAETQPGAEPSADSIRLLSQRYQDACAAYRSTGDSIEIVQRRATAITDRTSPEYNAAFEEYQALVARERQRRSGISTAKTGRPGRSARGRRSGSLRKSPRGSGSGRSRRWRPAPMGPPP